MASPLGMRMKAEGGDSSAARQTVSEATLGVAHDERCWGRLLVLGTTSSDGGDFRCRVRQAKSGVEELSGATINVGGDFGCRTRQAVTEATLGVGHDKQSLGLKSCQARQAVSGATLAVGHDKQCRGRLWVSGTTSKVLVLESCRARQARP